MGVVAFDLWLSDLESQQARVDENLAILKTLTANDIDEARKFIDLQDDRLVSGPGKFWVGRSILDKLAAQLFG